MRPQQRPYVRNICLLLCVGLSSWPLTAQEIGPNGIRVYGTGGAKATRSSGCLRASSSDGGDLSASRLRDSSPYNHRLLVEERLWQERLAVSASMYVIQADNAFAEPGGRVLLGQQLANRYIQRGNDYALQAMAYVAAHEFGHQLQFRFNQNLSSGPGTELQADMIAGYWAGMRLKEQVEQGLSKREAQQIMELEKNAAYDIGDYVFNSPQHHGTPSQRRRAVLEGHNAGYALAYGSDFRDDDAAKKLLSATREKVSEILQQP